jgi:hypothetical protein
MSESTLVRREGLIISVAERYQREGYDVKVDPGPSSIPFDLGGYRPDLIARKGDINLIIEIKTEAARISFDQLRSIVDEVKRHEGWRFVLITPQDVSDFAPSSEDEDQFSWEGVAHRIENAQRLSDLGESEAAYLILWIAFERMMRFQARRIELPVDRLAPRIVIRQMYSQGELSMAQFDIALACQEVRNRIVHGFPVPDLNDAVARLQTLVDELLGQWSAPSVAR